MPAIFRCSVCKAERELPGSGFSVEVCDSCDLALRRDKFKGICPPLYLATDPERLPVAQREAIMAWKYGPEGILASGPTGTGKTRCLWLLIQRLYLEDRLPIVAFDAVNFGHRLSVKYRQDKAEEWLDVLGQTPLVFFDDLGKLKLTDRAEAELFGVVEARCANRVPILCTTNDSGDSIAGRMTENRGSAFVRRLREFCKIVKF